MKIVYRICLIIGVACLIYDVFSYDQGIAASPRTPNVASGNVIQYNNHGTIVYITKKQDLIARWGPVGWLVWKGSADNKQ